MSVDSNKARKHTSKKVESERFPVIGIGASAGGLESIENFFQSVPENPGAAFIVVQHLSPDFESFMLDILSKKTKLKIETAKSGTLIEPNVVYLMPPKVNLGLDGLTIKLNKINFNQVPNKPIDLFFSSLAKSVLSDSVGIIFSGTGSDGSIGIQSINKAGGKVYIESVQTAQFDGMPYSAMSTNCYDDIDTPPNIALKLFGHLVLDKKVSGKLIEAKNDKDKSNIFKLIETIYGVDFARYKEGSINRRLEKRLVELKIKTLHEYWSYIRENKDEIHYLYSIMLIGVTSFFRDKEAFKILDKQIDTIIENKEDGDEVKIWTAGCASGEEAYSVAILFLEKLEKSGKELTLKILASDVDENSLDKASIGVYSKEQILDIPKPLLKKYFIRNKNLYRIIPDLSLKVVFAKHNLLSDPPFTKLDLISCRNLLIYLDNRSQKYALGIFFFSLNPKGILFLGPSESLGEMFSGLKLRSSGK